MDSVTPSGDGAASQPGSQPVLQAGRIGVEGGDLPEGVEVVEVAGSLSPAASVQQAHGPTETDVVADHREQVTGRRPACPGRADQHLQFAGEPLDLGRLLVGHRRRQPAQRRQ